MRLITMNKQSTNNGLIKADPLTALSYTGLKFLEIVTHKTQFLKRSLSHGCPLSTKCYLREHLK